MPITQFRAPSDESPDAPDRVSPLLYGRRKGRLMERSLCQQISRPLLIKWPNGS